MCVGSVIYLVIVLEKINFSNFLTGASLDKVLFTLVKKNLLQSMKNMSIIYYINIRLHNLGFFLPELP